MLTFLIAILLTMPSGQISKQERSMLKGLPWSRYEVEKVSELLNGESYYSSEASEKEFKQKSPSYGIVHLATHAIIDDESPSYSKLIFSDGGDKSEDGVLYSYELYNLKLNAGLVVLSSCRTGGGKLFNGEGVFSIARAFMYAGISSIIMSLWNIDDRSTAEIMIDFYERLANGENKTNALRNAKLNYLSNSDQLTANPVYWAGLVSVGDQKRIEIQHNSKIIIYILIAALLLASSLILIRSKSNKRTIG